ncbi:MAG: D-aminoacyl-tRNA deacylase [Planctomycetota bacterium]|nr:D-aminoacyl-tRNA deacylase [Planctomycetota bacterium]
MRALLQRVSSAQVSVDGQVVGAIGRGLLVLLGIHKTDTEADGDWIARKILAIRIFEDDAGKMNRSVQDIGGALLVVSQFTLYGSLLKGTRPGFSDAMPGEQARAFYAAWVAKLRQSCTLEIKEGIFAAKMAVQLVNDGPVTIMLDSRRREDERA